MAVVTISEAARLTGKNRKTIQRYVADGKLSLSQDVAGDKGIDTSELMRVFGELSQPTSTLSHATESQPAAPHVAPHVAALEARIEGLEALVKAKDETIDGLRQAMRLLEDRRPAQPAPAPVRPPQPPAKPAFDWMPMLWIAVGIAGVLLTSLVIFEGLPR